VRLLVSCVVAALLIPVGIPSAARADDAAAAKKAGDYLVSKLVSGNHLESLYAPEFVTGEAIVALTALDSSAYAEPIAAMKTWLATKSEDYSEEDPTAAARMALAAGVAGSDLTSFGAVNLKSTVKAAFAADGSFAASPNPYSSAVAIMAMMRSGQAVPAKADTWLAAQINSDGSFAYQKGDAADAEVTAMVIMALASFSNPPKSVQTALDKAIAWAKKAQASNGSWTSSAPVGGTALLSAALSYAEADNKKARSFVTGTQLSDGSFPAAKGGKSADLLVTTQAILALTKKTYLTTGKVIPKQPSNSSSSSSGSTSKSTSKAGSSTSPSAGSASSGTGTTTSTSGATSTSTAAATASPTPSAVGSPSSGVMPGAVAPSLGTSIGPNGETIGPNGETIGPDGEPIGGGVTASIAEGPTWLDIQMPFLCALFGAIALAFVLIRVRNEFFARRARPQRT
jgi:hypothetical protein